MDHILSQNTKNFDETKFEIGLRVTFNERKMLFFKDKIENIKIKIKKSQFNDDFLTEKLFDSLIVKISTASSFHMLNIENVPDNTSKFDLTFSSDLSEVEDSEEEIK